MPLKLIEKSQELLGTRFDLSLAHEEGEGSLAVKLINDALKEGARIEKAYSRFLDGNELAKINGRLREWVVLKDELFELISYGGFVKKCTNGAFDISVKTILDGWGYDKNYSFQESDEGNVGSVELDCEKKMIKTSSELDLGGLGKGYAIDQMEKILSSQFSNFCIDGGGDIFCRGLDENKKPWKVHFGDPTDKKKAIGFVEVANFACAASNPSFRKWKNRHHLVNPKTNKPASEMLAVYTQASDAITADAYATAFFAMGYDTAKIWLSENKAAKTLSGGYLAAAPIEAMLISPMGGIFRSDGFKGELFME